MKGRTFTKQERKEIFKFGNVETAQRRYDCPQCHRRNALTHLEAERGQGCDRCREAADGS